MKISRPLSVKKTAKTQMKTLLSMFITNTNANDDDDNFYGAPQSLKDIPPCGMEEEVLHLHQAITKHKVWHLVRLNPPQDKGFMFSHADWRSECEHEPAVEADGHSGASLACTWRACQLIARIGWKKFCESYSQKAEVRQNEKLHTEEELREKEKQAIFNAMVRDLNMDKQSLLALIEQMSE